jgi:hypothetical protein
MVVTTQCKGHKIIGLNVGAGNVRRYFPKRIPSIELHLGHLHIQCQLGPEFWRDQPEIHDPRLSDWLEAAHLRPSANRDSVQLEMVRAGKNAFRLRPMPRNFCPSTKLPCPVHTLPIHPVAS